MIENLFGGGGGGGTVDTVVAGTGISVDSTDPANPIITNTSLNTDEVAKVSSNDTTAGYLNGKLVAGSNITFTENNNGANETLTIAATGLTGFTASQNTASPNNTVNASRLLVDATSTNADAVLQPKGTGAILAQLPDGTATGGNKRGSRAVDFQTSRGINSQVASGIESVIGGGVANQASAQYAVIAGGYANQATGTASSVTGGSSCLATGSYSVACGGQSSQAAGAYAFVGGGNSNYAGGYESGVMSGNSNYVYSKGSYVGGGQGARIDRDFQYAFAPGIFAAIGDCQYERYVQRRITTNATQTELSNDGSAPASTTRIQVSSDSTYTFRALLTARRTDADNESAGYKIEGVIDNNAGTTAFVGTPTVTVISEDTAAWDVVVEADNTNDALVIKVTGEANKTIRWGAVVELMKVGG